MLKQWLVDPIPEITVAAGHLNLAVTAHLNGDFSEAEDRIRLADIHKISDWTEALWGRSHALTRRSVGTSSSLPKDERVKARKPRASEIRLLLARDGFHCRFCGIPVIRSEIRKHLQSAYPDALRWGKTNPDKHAAFKALWMQYDHVVPHAHGGTNEVENVIVACAPCNCARMDCTLEEVGLEDPRMRMPVQSSWDGLERLIA
jgi:hypothetical protein